MIVPMCINKLFNYMSRNNNGNNEVDGQPQQPQQPQQGDPAPQQPGHQPDPEGEEDDAPGAALGQYSESNKKEETRGKMASVFISGFFMIIIISFVYAGWQKASLGEVTDSITAIIGALSGLVGFVIGYYFKGDN